MRDLFAKDCLISEDIRKELVMEENGRKFRVKNEYGYKLIYYQIDGCIRMDGKKCDKGLVIEEANTLFLVELKGKNLRTAAEQILATLESCANKLNNALVHGRIVLSRVQRPDLRSTSVMRLEKKLRTYGGRLVRGTKEYTENV